MQEPNLSRAALAPSIRSLAHTFSVHQIVLGASLSVLAQTVLRNAYQNSSLRKLQCLLCHTLLGQELFLEARLVCFLPKTANHPPRLRGSRKPEKQCFP